HLPGLPAALPAHHDDHPGRHAGRAAAGLRQRRGFGTAPAPGVVHRRRPPGEPGADPLHHAGDLSLPGPFQQEVRRSLAAPPSRLREPRDLPGAPSMNLRAIISGLLVTSLCGCAIGPDYKRPEVATPAAYKEQNGWKPAAVAAMPGGGAWWRIYNDP